MTHAGGVRLGRSSTEALDRRLAVAVQAELTYDHVGSTLRPHGVPDRRRRSVRHTLAARDVHAFDAAVAGLRSWVPQRHLGARIHPPDASATVGETLLVVLAAGPIEVTAPNRIVWVVDEADRYGYAYGTLPGHPAAGEECFLVERIDDHRLRLTVTVDAAPATLATRVLAPLVVQVSHLAVRRYLGGLARHIGR